MEQKLKELIADNMDVEISDIQPESNFIEDFGIDSLEMIELIVELEKEFDIMITNEEMADIKTYGDLLAFLQSKQS